MKNITFVMAHEMSHHLLGHSQEKVEVLALRWRGDDCAARLNLEGQADVIGLLIHRELYRSEPETDYWGRPVPADGSGDDRALYLILSPFFDGFVSLYESEKRCGYFSGSARHIVLHVFAREILPHSEPQGENSGATRSAPTGSAVRRR